MSKYLGTRGIYEFSRLVIYVNIAFSVVNHWIDEAQIEVSKNRWYKFVDHSKLRSNLRRLFKFGLEIIKFLSTMLVNMRDIKLGCAFVVLFCILIIENVKSVTMQTIFFMDYECVPLGKGLNFEPITPIF